MIKTIAEGNDTDLLSVCPNTIKVKLNKTKVFLKDFKDFLGQTFTQCSSISHVQ